MVSAKPADHRCRLWNICSQIYWVSFCYHAFFKCDPVYASYSCAFAGVRGATVYRHGSVAGKSMAENQKGTTSCLWKAAGNVCFVCYHDIDAGEADFRVGIGRNGRLGGRFMDLDRDYHGCSGWTLVLPTFPERKLGASDRGRTGNRHHFVRRMVCESYRWFYGQGRNAFRCTKTAPCFDRLQPDRRGNNIFLL